ncbi:hypothetical protein GCM10023237_08770 [Streptomyces coeruleoprunus]
MAGDTSDLPLTTRETVGTDTPASRAMSVIVTFALAVRPSDPSPVPLPVVVLSAANSPTSVDGCPARLYRSGRTLETLQQSSGRPEET